MLFEKLAQSKGSAVLIVLALIAMLTGIAIMSVDRSTTDIELSYNELHGGQAFYTAEAGITNALTQLKDDYFWRGPIVSTKLGDGEYAVIVLDSTWDPALDDTLLVKSTASFMGSAANLESWVAPVYWNPFRWAAFGEDSVIMRNTGCTDSYDSYTGDYTNTQLNDSANVGSNGRIKLSNQANINGTAYTSDTGGITTDNSSLVNGDTSTTEDPIEIDQFKVTDSEYNWAESNSSAPLGFNGDYHYNSTTDALLLNNYDTLELSSGVYYFSSISLGQQSAITLAPGANVTIYMTDNLSIGQGSSINPGGSPSDFIIYSQGDELNINQGTEFRAAFWGPNTDIKVEQNTDVYGALSGQTIRIVNSACIHYDRSLFGFQRKEIETVEQVAWRQE